MRKTNALGFIEVYGLVAGIEAADAMLKTAQVRILREHGVRPGLISLVVEGDLAACRAAVDAGVAAASRLGNVIASHVIGRPDGDTETMVLEMLGETAPQAKEPETESPPAEVAAPPVLPEPAEKPKPAQSAAKTKTSASTRGKLGEVLAYIAGSKSGCTWKELRTYFPGLSQHMRKQLDAAVASGELLKARGRYSKPGAKD